MLAGIKLKMKKKTKNIILKNIKNDEFMYFVHSYFVVPKNKDIILTKSKYGNRNFCSSISSKNVFAFQFHPEKSGIEGLKIYKNFKSIVRKKLIMKVYYNLPRKVYFCKKCVNSNQYPVSTVEFKHTKNRKEAKYINFNSSGICDGCIQADVKQKINWKNREKKNCLNF